jgi:hypothetical protein
MDKLKLFQNHSSFNIYFCDAKYYINQIFNKTFLLIYLINQAHIVRFCTYSINLLSKFLLEICNNMYDII